MTPPSVAVLPDFPEEGWASMDLCAEMLLAHWPDAARVAPPFRRLAGRLPLVGKRGAAFNTDRVLNRLVWYPRFARRQATRFDAFHVVDHSYAALAHALPAGRTGVMVHDLDAFRCLLDPAAEPRPRWFRALARRTLTGLQKAAVVFHVTKAVGEELARSGLLDAGKLRHAPNGVSREFTPHGPDADAPPWLRELAGRPWVAHVGSAIPRKRIDVLLDVVARLRDGRPDLRLVKVGGEFTAAHRAQIARLGLSDAVVHAHGLTRPQLAAVYRAAPAVLQTSDAEGFGLPVVEALACGAAVVASDIPVLREVGSDVVTFAPVGDVGRWVEAVEAALSVGTVEAREARLAWASRFTWAKQAGTIAAAYTELLRQ